MNKSDAIKLINYKEIQRAYIIVNDKLEALEKEVNGYTNYIKTLEKDNEMLANKVKIYQEILDKIVKGGK